MSLLQALTCLFGLLSLLALIASGFTMMLSRQTGRTMLKNVFIAMALFVIGSMLLQAACNGLGHWVQYTAQVRSSR